VCTYMYKALELRSATSRFFKKNRFLCQFPICPVSIGSRAGLKTKTRHRSKKKRTAVGFERQAPNVTIEKIGRNFESEPSCAWLFLKPSAATRFSFST